MCFGSEGFGVSGVSACHCKCKLGFSIMIRLIQRNGITYSLDKLRSFFFLCFIYLFFLMI